MVDRTKFERVSQKQFRTVKNVGIPSNRSHVFYTDGHQYFNFYAKCLACGECHYLNENDQMHVNGRIVKSCIACNVTKYEGWLFNA